MTSLLAEAIEEYADTAKDLAKKWHAYASHVADNLDTGYDADRASADIGTAVSLTIETGGRLAWNALGAVAIVMNKPGWVESKEEFSTQLKGAKLELKEPLKNRPGQTVAPPNALVVPPKLGPEQQKFRIRVDTSSAPAGIYRGTVVATKPPDQPDKVPVRIEVP